MSKNSVNMLSSTVSGTTAVTGNKISGDSFYGFTDGLHTIAIYPTNFLGQVEIQATLAENPTNSDYFNITLKNGQYATYNQQSSVDGYTFQGNFLYLRALVTPQAGNTGTRDKILLNY